MTGATVPTRTPAEDAPRRIGRRVVLGMAALGAAGIAFGSSIQRFLGNIFGQRVANLLPGFGNFQIYTITGSYPVVTREEYRLKVSGLVERPLDLTIEDLESMAKVSLVRDFQCVTGWRVSTVPWEGVLLSDVLKRAGLKAEATALAFDSYDNADTESLTLDQAMLPDVMVAYRMLGAPITTEHGGPVRLYVAPMFGYKSLKWLSGIRVVDEVEPGFWEQNGYPLNGWIDGSTVAPVAGNDNETVALGPSSDTGHGTSKLRE